MKIRIKPFILISALICLMGTAVMAQNKPLVYTLGPKLAIAKLPDGYEVRGKISYTLVAVNSDDTLVGTFTYSIPDDARQKIAQLTGKQVADIPSSFTMKDVIAEFQKATACPVIHIEIKPMEMDAASTKIRFHQKMVLDIQGREPGSSASLTPQQEMDIHFCVLTRQINTGRLRRGVIARMNQILTGEEQ